MSEPKPETLPTAGGTYVQHADGRLERIDDLAANEPTAPEPAAPAKTPKNRAATSATPE